MDGYIEIGSNEANEANEANEVDVKKPINKKKAEKADEVPITIVRPLGGVWMSATS